MKLKKLIQGLDSIEVKGSKEIEISGICVDSRRVAPGNLFIALRGSSADGNQFLPQAIESGAIATLGVAYQPFLGKTTQIIHPHPQDIEAILADRFYRCPSHDLFVFGVTGTKGKTTTTYLVKHLLDAKEKKCGLIGTVETILGDKRSFSNMTTHDVVHNHKVLREMIEAGSTAAAMEASSHGLAQGRLNRIHFDAALFTNLAPDHLDFHLNMEGYAEAKRILFRLLNESDKPNKCAIANADDPYSSQLLEGCTARKLSFGLSDRADVRAENIVFTMAGMTFTIRYQEKSCCFRTSLIGRFNVYNLLGAITLGLHLGYSLEEMVPIFDTFHTVPGRLERVLNKSNIHVFVDYAHTNESLDNVLTTLREVAKGRIIVVFGAGGNRDPGRRPGLAHAAEKGADLSIVTSDNPRQEDPEEICRQILAGFSKKTNVIVELDRKLAIELAVAQAQPNDIVLIAGKGHERVQIFSHQTVPFDDRIVVAEALAKRGNL